MKDRLDIKGEGRVERNKRVRSVEPVAVALITYNIGVVSYSFVQKKSSISILRNDVYYDSIHAMIHYDLSLSYHLDKLKHISFNTLGTQSFLHKPPNVRQHPE